MISAQRATTCHDSVCCDDVLSADPRNSYFSEQRLPLIVAIEFEDIAMFSDPWSDLVYLANRLQKEPVFHHLQ